MDNQILKILINFNLIAWSLVFILSGVLLILVV